MTAPKSIMHAWLLRSLRPYDRRWLRFDIVAGVVAGTVVIPQAMAYATIAGMPVEVGLYTCMAPMLVLFAIGAASLAGGLTQSLPPAGGFSQSAVNQRSGARTQLAGVITAILAVLVALFLGPVLDDLPRAILAAIVIVATLGLVDFAAFARYYRIDRAEFWVAATTAGLGLTAGLLLAVGVGVALTLLLVLRQVSRSRVRRLYPRADGGWTTNPRAEDAPTAAAVPDDLLLLHFDGGLYTGNAQVTQDAILELARAATPPPRAVVLEASAVHQVTVTMLDAMQALQADLRTEGISLYFAGVPAEALAVARRSNWFARLERDGHVQPTVDAAIALAITDSGQQ